MASEAPYLTGAPSGIRTLLLVALAFQALITVFWVVIFSGSGVGVAVAIGFLGLIMLVLAYTLTYARSCTPEYSTAVGPTLLFGILGLVLGLIIVGILYLLAYVRLNEAVQRSIHAASQVPQTVIVERIVKADPPAQKHCSYCGIDYPATMWKCPRCGASA